MVIKGDPYLQFPGDPDPDKRVVLRNKLGITSAATLRAVEERLATRASINIQRNSIPGKFDLAHYQKIHERLFGDVYHRRGEHAFPIAGAIRKIGIAKPMEEYPHPDHPDLHQRLDARLDYAFGQLEKDQFLLPHAQDRKMYIALLARHTAEIWECHPFREGNTRTTLVFADHLARHAGMEIRGAGLMETRQIRDYRDALKSWLQHMDPHPLRQIYDQTLQEKALPLSKEQGSEWVKRLEEALARHAKQPSARMLNEIRYAITKLDKLPGKTQTQLKALDRGRAVLAQSRDLELGR